MLERELAVTVTPSWDEVRPLGAVKERHLHGEQEHEPLFEPRWQRELLHVAAGLDIADGEIDEATLVDTIAAARSLQQIPRLPRRSIKWGVQLLVDVGESMEPFREDIRRMVDELGALVGRSSLEVREFVDSPRRKPLRTRASPAAEYMPPPPGTPVIALVALRRPPGLPPLPEQDWMAFAHALTARGSPVVALSPYGPPWPAWLGAIAALLQWDRLTTVGAVLEARRRQA